MKRFRLSVLLGLVVLMSLAPTSSAFAVPPSIEVVQVDDTFVVPAGEGCTFAVEARVTGTVRTLTTYDQNGTPVRTVVTGANVRISLTNQTNGHSITRPIPGPLVVTNNSDGSATLHLIGPWQVDVSFHYGVLILNPNGQVIFEAGHWVDTAAICVALQ